MLNTMILTVCAVLTQAGDVLPPPPVVGGSEEAGSSRMLPDLSKAFDKISTGFKGIPQVVDAAREGKARLDPLLEEFRVNRTLENQGKLERQIASFTSDLAHKIRRATATRENVVFGFQDLTRGVHGMRSSLSGMAGDLLRRSERDRIELERLTERMEDAARDWELADEGPEKTRLLGEFKQLYRMRKRMAYRVGSLRNLARKYQRLSGAVGDFTVALEGINVRVEDVFDRLEDSEMMLTFAAGYRRDMTDVLSSYHRSFGKAGSVKEVLENIRSIQGQLNLLDKTIAIVDEADSLGPLMEDLSGITAEISEEEFDPTVPGGGTSWETRIEEFLAGNDPTLSEIEQTDAEAENE